MKNWSGYKVDLYPTDTHMAGRKVKCIRIRAPHAAPGATLQAQAASLPKPDVKSDVGLDDEEPF